MHKSQHIRKRCHWYFTFTKQTLYKLHSATLSSKPWPPILPFGALLKFGTNVLGDGCTCTWNMLMTVLLCAPCVCVCREQSFRSFSSPSFLTQISYWKAHFWSWLSSRGNLKFCQFVTPHYWGCMDKLCHIFYVGLRIRTRVLMPSCLQNKSSYHGAISTVLFGSFPYWYFCNYLYPYMLFVFIFCHARAVHQVKWG